MTLAVDDELWEGGVSKDLYDAFCVLSKVPVSYPNLCVSVVNLNCLNVLPPTGTLE